MSNDNQTIPLSPLLRKQKVYLRANVRRGTTVVSRGAEYEVVGTYEFHDAVRIRNGKEESIVTRAELVTIAEHAAMQSLLEADIAKAEDDSKKARIKVLQPVVDLYLAGTTEPKEIAAKLGFKNDATAWSRIMEAKKLKLITTPAVEEE